MPALSGVEIGYLIIIGFAVIGLIFVWYDRRQQVAR